MGINFVIILDLVVNIHRSGGGPSDPPPPTWTGMSLIKKTSVGKVAWTDGRWQICESYQSVQWGLSLYGAVPVL